jgi:hypothetical protein
LVLELTINEIAMTQPHFSTSHIEYFGKDFLDSYERKIDSSSLTISFLKNIRFLKIKSVSNFWESLYGKQLAPHVFMEDILSGLCEENIPLVFAIIGDTDEIEVLVGSFADTEEKTIHHLKLIKTSLQSTFQGIEIIEFLEAAFNNRIAKFNISGLLTGSPGKDKVLHQTNGNTIDTEQIERLIRGLYGQRWGYMVIAKPGTNNEVNHLYNKVLNEMRIIINTEKGTDSESPVGKRYKKLLETYLDKLQKAKSQGLWHCTVFLFAADSPTLSHLKAVVKSSLGGHTSVPDRVRTFTLSQKIEKPGLIINPAPESPGYFKHPYGFSNTLHSAALANYIQLPSREMPGFQIKPYAQFKVSTDQKKENTINIGKILDQGKETGSNYTIQLKKLKKHGLIVGGTGSGKTNTLFYLLKEVWKHKIPFMVIEPVKTEYRKLLLDKNIGPDLQVFTLGNNNVSPFRINPFEIMPGIPVQTHIDLLKAVFNASFFMWGPLPHVLERCIHDIYTDKGWDLTSNQNHRGIHQNSNPTLTDLHYKIDEVVNRLGYSPETTMEISSALKTRINSLRIGGKGLMLDTRTSIPFESLVGKPTILELEPIGDDEEKSFMMGLILTMMYESHISKGISENKGPVHLTIVEEAHRLLGNYAADNAFTANVKGKAVETFTNILAEIRAYGEGFLIAEQIPTKLASDVIKNTNLKVMHRVVAEDDRKVMGATMNVQERETRKIVSLNVGEAAIYSEGDDGAYHVKVPFSKIEGEASWKGKGDEIVIKAMHKFKQEHKKFAPFEACSQYCKAICEYKNKGSDVVQHHRYYSRFPVLLLSILHDVDDLENILLQMFENVEPAAKNAGGIRICSMIQGVTHYCENLGNRYKWPYEEVNSLQKLFTEIYYNFLKNYEETKGQVSIFSVDQQKFKKFRNLYFRMSRGKQPTPFCQKICPNNQCLYRFNMPEALSDDYFNRKFLEIVNEGGEEMWYALDQLCKEAAREAILPGANLETTARIGLCFALQKAYGTKSFRRDHIKTIMEHLTNANIALTNIENE